MNRIREKLKSKADSKLLVPFFTGGYPNISSTLEYIKTASGSGADMIEIGIPFSDPLADGSEIQFSSKHALDQGITLKRILTLVEKVRLKSDIPILLMGYFNPIHSFGQNKFFKAASNSGVDGLIIPDLPVEEANDFKMQAESNNLSTTFLVSPTSSIKRIKMIDKGSSDFVYAVTITGVTGTGQKFDSSTDQYLKSLKNKLTKPFVAGFGISSAEDAKRLTRYSDGVVIGSALVKLIRSAKSTKASYKSVEKFLNSIRKAI